MMKFDLQTLNRYVQESDICCEKHPDTDLYIYGYYITSRSTIKWDNINKHCRGMIVNSKGEVIEHPFTKFWTFKQYLSKELILLSEGQIFKIPKCDYRILEKVDGSMCTLYWINDKPYLATQRSFTNIKARVATKMLYEKYSHTFSKFNRNYTYIFEAVYPETKVLIDYGETRDLFLIGIVNKETGELMPFEDIGFPPCKDYTQQYGHLKDFNELISLDLPNQEGFVIHFANGQLLKLKFPWYQKAHQLLDFIINKDRDIFRKKLELAEILGKKITLRNISNLDIWKALKMGDIHLESIKKQITISHRMMGFDVWLEEMISEIKRKFVIEKEQTGLSDYEIMDRIKPKAVVEFDLEKRQQTPHIYETNIWKWQTSLLNL